MTPRFDYPWMVLGALALAVGGCAAFWWWHRRRLGRLRELGTDAAIVRLASEEARRAPRARALRVSAALGLMGLAFAGPRWGAGANLVRADGIDVVLAMDASLSMQATDERPSRLERMKQEVRRFRALAPGNRVALLAFAGRSYILSPLTTDDGAIELFLDNLDPTVVGQPGSAMAAAIRQGTDLLVAAKGAAGRGLVVLSDGEAFDDHLESMAAAKAAADAEIGVVMVGFGTEGGSTIPVIDGSEIIEKRDDAGAVVITRYDPAFLGAVAKAGRGEFIPASATDKASRMQAALGRLESRQRSVEEGRARPLRLAWVLLPAILLLLIDAWRSDGGTATRLRRWMPFVSLLVLVLGAPRPAGAQERDPVQLFKAGRFAQAAGRWRQLMAEGDRRAATLYNLGTALLAADSLVPAIEMLERATLGGDPGIRQKALFNLGLAHLRRGSQAQAPDTRELDAALAAYRAVLLQKGSDADAAWNYELALQKKRQGGGGNRSDPQQNPQQSPRAPQEQRKGMSSQQADQLLSAAARDEKESQARRQRGLRQERAPGSKDW